MKKSELDKIRAMISKFFSKKMLKFAVGCLISLAAMLWIFFTFDIKVVFNIIGRTNLYYLLLILILTVIQLIIRVYRWRFLLPTQEQRLTNLFLLDCSMLGNLGNFILPFRAGEFIRPLMLAKYSKVNFSIGFTSIITERFFDLTMVLLLFIYVLFSMEEVPFGEIAAVDHSYAEILELLKLAAISLGSLAVILLLCILLGIYCPNKIACIVEKVIYPCGQKVRSVVISIMNNFFIGTAVLQNPKRLCAVISLSVVIWSLTFFTYWVGFLMFPESSDMKLWDSIALTTILALGVAVPSAPGFVGVFETACIVSFAFVGEDLETATAYAIVNHLLQYVLIIIYGCAVLYRYGLKLTDLKNK